MFLCGNSTNPPLFSRIYTPSSEISCASKSCVRFLRYICFLLLSALPLKGQISAFSAVLNQLPLIHLLSSFQNYVDISCLLLAPFLPSLCGILHLKKKKKNSLLFVISVECKEGRQKGSADKHVFNLPCLTAVHEPALCF